MSYSIVQPPFTLRFRDMSAQELKDYRRWFLEIIPSRVIELQGAVNSDPNFWDWKPDHSRASVRTLGMWLSQQIETRPRTSEEIERIKGRAALDFDAPTAELMNRTFSLAMDAGMYFGETLRKCHPHLEWDQSLKDKKFADHGQMVLIGFGRATLNPVRIAVTFCYGVALHSQTAQRFDEAYEYWSRLAG